MTKTAPPPVKAPPRPPGYYDPPAEPAEFWRGVEYGTTCGRFQGALTVIALGLFAAACIAIGKYLL